ncbi:MAG: DUF1772 domain-containing protein [Saprospiraceae bacterium]|nr:DUF1772 domain-containing protein [Saprospiraceae bacterium]
MFAETLLLLSCGILGIFLGAQLAEAMLLVPYWKALDADDFFRYHKTYGKKIYKFFAPLTIAATILPVATVVYNAVYQLGDQPLLIVVGLSTVAFFSTYFLYFKRANQSFADRSLSNQELSSELMRWGKWHWGRISFEFIAFVSALLLVISI